MPHLFGTSGIRGDSELLFTDQFCFDLGRTFAKFLDNHNQPGRVAVGRDSRQSSPRIKAYLTAGLIHEGREVVDEGMLPTPAMNWLLVATDVAASVMITGSHIKEGLNGVKFFAFKEEILKQHEEEIEEIYASLDQVDQFKPKEAIQERTAVELYKKMLIELANGTYPSWKVVVDTGNGTQSNIIPEVLEKLGLTVFKMHTDIAGNFMARDTEVDGIFDELGGVVIKQKANFGLAFDTDGDRVVFVDEKGQFVSGDYTGSLISKYGSTKFVVTPINTSQVVQYLGKPVIRTEVGSPYVVAKMKEVGADFGFEANGGGFSAEIMMSRDGGSTAIKILNLLKTKGCSLKELVNQLPEFHLYRTKIDCPSERNHDVLSSARDNFKGKKTEELDGLKIWIDEFTWILFRPSRNAAEFRVFAEAKTLKEATKLGQDGVQLVRSIIIK